MPTLAPFSANTETFNPVRHEGGVVKWADQAGGIPMDYPVVTAALRDATAQNGNYKGQLKIVVPRCEVLNGGVLPTKLHETMFNLDGVMPAGGSLADRTQALNILRDAIAVGSPFETMFLNLENFYG